MINLKIDNTEIESTDGLTVLEIAEREGIKIPTLCNSKGLPHYSSCMVCMVKDKRNNSFFPSCSALVQNGMDIDTSGPEVLALRRKAIELLLSEHRAECEAPCRMVCPAGYNIPLMNRLLSDRELEKAENLSVSQLNTPSLWCLNCPGYCENACRRKKIDLPVSIRNLQIHIYNRTNPLEELIEQAEGKVVNHELQKPVKEHKRFSSLIGKVENAELEEWLKECKKDIQRHSKIADVTCAEEESESCMHCDCRAADSCSLRDVAGSLSVKDPRGKLVNSPIVKKINNNTGLIFENAKCIKCGLCVRLCADSIDEPALCFLNRGFISIISEPLTAKFDDILKSKTRAVIDICPTGALSQYFR